MINGQKFLCRLLKVGTKDGDPNEWDSTLDVLGEENHLWHWENSFFWGQERTSLADRAFRGYSSARRWYWNSSSYRDANLGFRPVLEPLPADKIESGDLVCAIGGQSVLYGSLLEITNYDVILQPESVTILAQADKGKLYTEVRDGLVIVDRNQMTVQRVCPV